MGLLSLALTSRELPMSAHTSLKAQKTQRFQLFRNLFLENSKQSHSTDKIKQTFLSSSFVKKRKSLRSQRMSFDCVLDVIIDDICCTKKLNKHRLSSIEIEYR